MDYSAEFPQFDSGIYLDCAYQGPFPRSAVERITEAIEWKRRPSILSSKEYFELPDRVRRKIAGLIGADPSEIALTNSATQGIGLAAEGLKLTAGDEVVVASNNFPANLYTWLHLGRRGIRTHMVRPVDGEIRAADVAAVMTRRTKVLALDWVSYSTGARIDLAALGEMIHSHGGLFLVDGTQGVGALELKVHEMPIDVMAVAGYKWLLGPYATGFAYLSWKAQELIELKVVNWATVEGADHFDYLPVDRFTLPKAARIFDMPETGNFLGLAGLEASLDFILRVGVGKISSHSFQLLDLLAERLQKRGYKVCSPLASDARSTIVAFSAATPQATEELHGKLRSHGIAVSLRYNMIRVSPHVYNTEAQMGRFLELT
jgi:selenocysteine lyase/cysteine desulfurase